eukprot:9760672-Ditylum_brightwellii.AAC.1
MLLAIKNNDVDDGDDDGVEDGVDDSVEDGDDDGFDDVDDGADKHLTHCLQGVDCRFTQRSKQNKHFVSNKDDDVDDDDEYGICNRFEDRDNDGVDDGVDGADKHLTHLSQVFDCHLTLRIEGNEHVVGINDKDIVDGVDDGVEDVDDDSVEDGDDDGVDDSDD